jgi:hypothetical protein
MKTQEVSEADLVAKIRPLVDGKDIVDLTHHAFDRLPCTRRRLYAVCRKYASAWGYEYDKAEYVASGNRPFQRNHKRGYVSGPWLRKRKKF